jgi:hypothetical protein
VATSIIVLYSDLSLTGRAQISSKDRRARSNKQQATSAQTLATSTFLNYQEIGNFETLHRGAKGATLQWGIDTPISGHWSLPSDRYVQSIAFKRCFASCRNI